MNLKLMVYAFAGTSVYGNTKKAVELLVSELERCARGSSQRSSKMDMAEAVEDAF